MKKLIPKLFLLTVITLIISSFVIYGSAARDYGNTRDVTVYGITVTAGNKTITNVYSDPVDYWELVDSGSLNDVEIIYDSIGNDDTVLYTAWYPDTTTGRRGEYTEYVCEYKNGGYTVTSINESGDGSTYIPINGFVLSVSNLYHPDFATLGDKIRLGGSNITIPTKAVESENGKRVVIDDMNVSRSHPMVVYYDYRYGAKTGTNIYGTEMICQYDQSSRSFVVSGFRGFLSGDASGSDIPDGGFVISAYGTGYRQLLLCGQLFRSGDKIKLTGFSYADMNNAMIGNTYNQLVNQADSAITDAQAKIDALYDIDTERINGYIYQVNAELERLKQIKSSIDSAVSDTETAALMMDFSTCSVTVEELCQKINVASAESNVISARSTWHRPCEKSYAEIESNVKTFRDVGINLIFVETFYHGCSSFRSDLPDIPYHPSLAQSYKDSQKGITYDDYLSAFVACCGDYGIEVHAWVENFYVGIDPNAKIVVSHPDWIMYNDDGSYIQRKEGGPYIFIDPANLQVQDTLIAYYNELFDKHPEIAGLNLDYIRYPVSNASQDTGFTVAAMTGFYEQLGKSFTEEQLADRRQMTNRFLRLFDKDYLKGGQAEADENYRLWVEYRTAVITDFVSRIKDEVKKPNEIILSTAVFASLSESLNTKKADWQGWFSNGWIDIATPMAYYTSSDVVYSRVYDMIQSGGNSCLYYTGIASSYSGLPAWQSKEFILASYKAGAQGYVIFSSAQIIGHNDVIEVLVAGVNSKKAVLPHASINIILKTSFADLLDKADRLYITSGGMTQQSREALETILVDIQNMPCNTSADIQAISLRITELKSTISEYASGNSSKRIAEQLDYLINLIDARSNMDLANNQDNNTDVEDNPITPPDGEENSPDYPDSGENSDNPENNGSKPNDQPHKLGFFARIWQAIANFFRKLFGIKH